jgi:hypothetical protein
VYVVESATHYRVSCPLRTVRLPLFYSLTAPTASETLIYLILRELGYQSHGFPPVIEGAQWNQQLMAFKLCACAGRFQSHDALIRPIR